MLRFVDGSGGWGRPGRRERRAPALRVDDARHRPARRGVPEHRLASPQRGPDARPDRGGDARARHPRRPKARLSTQPARPWPPWGADDAPRRGRAGHHRPVLRRRRRGPLDGRDEPRLQPRARPRARTRRRGHRAHRRPRDAALRRDRSARRPAGPAPPARGSRGPGGPGRGPVAGLQPAGRPHGRRRQPGGRWRGPRAPRRARSLAHRLHRRPPAR